ncbi:DMT family transporter [Acetobacter musti]|nr:DMT family transporter [Acetobacter musti]
MKAGWFLLAILAGLTNPLQSAANSGFSKAAGPALALIVLYATAIATLACALPFFPHAGSAPVTARLAKVPWWAWTGGALNATFALCATLATRQIGSASFTVTVLVCAVILSVALDHFGLLGLEQHRASWPRIAGSLMAIAGVILISRT